MSLPYNDSFSITVTNTGWYTDKFLDVCVYTNGPCGNPDTETGGKIEAVRVQVTFKLLGSIKPDFVSIHNGLIFDLRHMA